MAAELARTSDSGSNRDTNEFASTGAAECSTSAHALQKIAEKTSARIMTAEQFKEIKNHLNLYVVGVTGSLAQWSQEHIDADPKVKDSVTEANLMLKIKLMDLDLSHDSHLVVASGGTFEGVPKLVYDACEDFDISAMGVVCFKAADEELGKMDYVIVEGTKWGDESATFIDVCDEMIMIGGGPQAQSEVLAANAKKKPITVFQGFGGSADDMSPEQLEGADFEQRW